MTRLVEALARPLLQTLDAETAHRATMLALRAGLVPRGCPDGPARAVSAFGLRFPNRVGLAAGFDKNAEAVDALLALGFGSVEIGTVTPRPQPGNPRPRVFRLHRDRAVINRYGFNSEGHAAVHARLARRAHRPGIVGVNLGANKDSEDRVADYVAGVRTFADVATYFTINVSSPNTPGLRDLQDAQALDGLLARIAEARAAAAKPRPILLKIAPDVAATTLDDIVRLSLARGIDGLVVSNTTIARPETLADPQRAEAGGLSGRPLRALSTHILAETARRVGGAIPLVGVGGIDGPEAAHEKLAAGATLVQLYSALVYEGSGLIERIKAGL